MIFEDDIFVIDCWTDTVNKENDLISLIKIINDKIINNTFFNHSWSIMSIANK